MSEHSISIGVRRALRAVLSGLAPRAGALPLPAPPEGSPLHGLMLGAPEFAESSLVRPAHRRTAPAPGRLAGQRPRPDDAGGSSEPGATRGVIPDRRPASIAEPTGHPFFFGTSERRLFGIGQCPPGGAPGPCAGAVCCYPYGQDHVYAFRPYRSLAARLSRAGLYTLRFDYAGTGDSSGEIEDVSPRSWVTDVHAALDVVRSRGCRPLHLVGFRFGATMAVVAGAEDGAVDKMVLWDPILDGRAYAAALVTGHADWFRQLAREIPDLGRSVPDGQLFGFPFSDTFRSDLERVNLWSLSRRPAREVLLVSSVRGGDCQRFGEHLEALGSSVSLRTVEDVSVSSMVPGLPNALVPSRVLHVIAGWLAGEPV